MTIAIDGPAGAGKSTVARGVARLLGWTFLDTGAMYRAVTLEALRRGVDPSSEEGCCRVASSLELAFDSSGRILIDGVPGEPAIRTDEVTKAVSAVSAHPTVRRVIVAEQRALAAACPPRGGLVAEGRDTTTVVFPDATHKFFLIATASERAHRRARELNQVHRVDEIQADIERRDLLDTTRTDSPLLEARDAVRIETDGLSPDEVIARIMAEVQA